MTSVAVVTGAAGEIGQAVVTKLIAEGWHVVAVDKSEAVHLLSERSPAITSCTADLTTATGIATVDSAVRSTGLRLRALVNNAGITADARLANMTTDEFRRVIAVNLMAPIQLTSLLASRFEAGSSIVNMSSRAALGNFGQANYVASKSGLVGYTRSLALQLAPRLRVNAIAPGLIDTAMTRAIPDSVRAKLVSRVPLDRMGRPEEIANVVAFLCSSEASYVTGQVLMTCGGRSLAANEPTIRSNNQQPTTAEVV